MAGGETEAKRRLSLRAPIATEEERATFQRTSPRRSRRRCSPRSRRRRTTARATPLRSPRCSSPPAVPEWTRDEARAWWAAHAMTKSVSRSRAAHAAMETAFEKTVAVALDERVA